MPVKDPDPDRPSSGHASSGQPGSASTTFFRRGLALQRLGRHEGAEAAYREAIRLRPAHAAAHGNLGTVLQAQRRFDEAEHYLRKALELDPRNAGYLYNLASCSREAEKPEQAEGCYRGAIALDPMFYPAWNSLGNLLVPRGDLDEAEQCFRKALATDDPARLASTRYNLGQLELLRGDYANGWDNFEQRLYPPTAVAKWRNLPDPSRLWRGEPLQGGRLLVWCELGLGDTLQFVRYVPLLAERGLRVTAAVQAPLVGLVRASLPDQVDVIDRAQVTPDWDRHVSVMSLPRLLDPALDGFDWSKPYLRARARLSRAALGLPASGPLVGLVWASSPVHRPIYAHKSVPLEPLAKALLEVPGVTLVSLQVGRDAAQLDGLPGRRVLAPELDAASFERTAAVACALDAIVTIDTALAHLAGGLGLPVWTLLHFVPDWRWGLAGDTTYWYPRMRLLRQRSPGEWPPVLAELQRAIAGFLAAGSTRN